MTDPPTETKLSCRNLWKIFGESPQSFLRRHSNAPPDSAFEEEGYIGACRDVSFDVHAGEILMVMGLSGSGKSTLVRCLSRLIEPTSGKVLLDGEDLLTVPMRKLNEIRRRRIGMVFQHFGLLGHRTVLSNVAFPLEIQGAGRDEREQKARQMIETVGLEGREEYFPAELSGGQQQRVGLARSLAVDPEIWFLDEPFSALDPLIRRDMQDEFLRLQQALHKTIVFITHDFDEAVKLGDRIAILKDGRIEQLGTPEEIVLRPANDYVAQFAKDAPIGELVRVSTIMEEEVSDAGRRDQTSVRGSQCLNEVAPTVLRTPYPTPVVDEKGNKIGHITGDKIIDRLFEAV